ncbi:MAG: hypothetical protein WC974_09800, partial [Thermoplasmata archaeon]
VPTTWALDDAGQTAEEVAAAVPVYVPAYLGAHLDGVPSSAKEGDVYLLYSATPNTVTPPTLASPPDHRGVFRYTASAWVWTTDSADMYKAIRDIKDICALLSADTPPVALYGTEADYGVTSSIDVAHIKTALIDYLRGGDAHFSGDVNMENGTVRGVLDTPVLATTDPTDAGEIAAPAATHWIGSALVSHCSTLADGEIAVDATSTFDGKNVTKIYKNQAGTNVVSYQSDDSEIIATRSTGLYLLKTIVSSVNGYVRVHFEHTAFSYSGTAWTRIYSNGVLLSTWLLDTSPGVYALEYIDIRISIGDTIQLYVKTEGSAVPDGHKNFRISPTPNTIGVFNDTDGTVLVIDNAAYYTQTGNINLAGLADFIVSYTHWLGSTFISLFDGKVRSYIEQLVDTGTFNGKTPASVYISGTNSIRITFTDASTLTLNATGYYNYPTTDHIDLFDSSGAVQFFDDYSWETEIIGADTYLRLMNGTSIIAYISPTGVLRPMAGYKSVDDSTGATGSFTTADSKTVTVKNGLITAIV